MSSGLQSALFAMLLVGLALMSSVVGMLWRKDRARSSECSRLADDLERQGRALEGLIAGLSPATPERVRTSSPPTPSSRLRADTPTAKGPVLIAVPDLVPAPPEAVEVPAELARRFGAIWDLADSGSPTEAIARATGHPIGQVELMLVSVAPRNEAIPRRRPEKGEDAFDPGSASSPLLLQGSPARRRRPRGVFRPMTPTQRLILGIYAAIVANWLIRHVVIGFIYARFDVLKRSSPRLASAGAPLVSAIIPAKDERGTLGECLDSVRAQDYPNLEILVVDDRSTDGTADIALRAAEMDPRVRLISIRDLPEGWTGKTHALHVASGEAEGAWFWFLDADTRHAPESLSVMMEYARANGAEMASLVPEMRCESFWEKVVQPLAGIVLVRSFPLFLVNKNTSHHAFANGQYILMSRGAYVASGGHEAVRDRFVEDIYLAKKVKAAGLPIRVATSTEISSTRMYTDLPQIVRGWSRILYDALGRRPLPLIGKVVEPLIFSQTGDVALIVAVLMLALGSSGPFAWWLLGLAIIHQILKTSVLYRMYKFSSPSSAGYAVWYPLAGLIMAWVCAKSIWMCLTGRVTWRGTAYGPTLEKAHS